MIQDSLKIWLKIKKLQLVKEQWIFKAKSKSLWETVEEGEN